MRQSADLRCCGTTVQVVVVDNLCVCVCVLMRCLFLFLSPQLLSLLMLMPMLSPELLTATAIRGEGGGDLWKAENNSLAN